MPETRPQNPSGSQTAPAETRQRPAAGDKSGPAPLKAEDQGYSKATAPVTVREAVDLVKKGVYVPLERPGEFRIVNPRTGQILQMRAHIPGMADNRPGMQGAWNPDILKAHEWVVNEPMRRAIEVFMWRINRRPPQRAPQMQLGTGSVPGGMPGIGGMQHPGGF